jgi:membrane protein DedA with SNARE-associated domain
VTAPSDDDAAAAPDTDDTALHVDPERLHVPDEVSTGLKRFVLGCAIVRIGVPIVSFFTVVAPLVASIAGGTTSNIYWLTLLRPSKDSLLWGGALWRTRPGEVDLVLLFAAYAVLMIVLNWPFLYLGRAYGPALARGEGPAWFHRFVSEENLARARSLLARKGPTIAVVGRIAAFPPTVMSAAAGTSDVPAWKYQLADTVGGVAGFAVTVGLGVALGETFERAGIWVTLGGVALIFGAVSWGTNWLQREAERDAELAALADD